MSLSEEQIKNIKIDLEECYQHRMYFLIGAVASFTAAILFYIFAMTLSINSASYDPKPIMIIIAIIFSCVGIVCFVLRSALYNRRIRKNKRKLNDSKNNLQFVEDGQDDQ